MDWEARVNEFELLLDQVIDDECQDWTHSRHFYARVAWGDFITDLRRLACSEEKARMVVGQYAHEMHTMISAATVLDVAQKTLFKEAE